MSPLRVAGIGTPELAPSQIFAGWITLGELFQAYNRYSSNLCGLAA